MEQISRRWKEGPNADLGARVPPEGHQTFSTLRNNTGPIISSNWLDERRNLSPLAAISAAAH
jgi:hypothetical protein